MNTCELGQGTVLHDYFVRMARISDIDWIEMLWRPSCVHYATHFALVYEHGISAVLLSISRT